jgi:hypothetical protein
MTNELQIINAILNNATQTTVDAYSNWFCAAAICWTIFGLSLIIAGIYVFKGDKIKEKFDNDGEFWLGLVSLLSIFIGSVIVFAHLPDLFSPQGIAIHQLIRDLTGK